MKIIITGSTGMVGKAVLLECIDDTRVTEVLLINRSPLGVSHSKVTEVIHKDFMDFTPIREQLDAMICAVIVWEFPQLV